MSLECLNCGNREKFYTLKQEELRYVVGADRKIIEEEEEGDVDTDFVECYECGASDGQRIVDK